MTFDKTRDETQTTAGQTSLLGADRVSVRDASDAAPFRLGEVRRYIYYIASVDYPWTVDRGPSSVQGGRGGAGWKFSELYVTEKRHSDAFPARGPRAPPPPGRTGPRGAAAHHQRASIHGHYSFTQLKREGGFRRARAPPPGSEVPKTLLMGEIASSSRWLDAAPRICLLASLHPLLTYSQEK